MASLIEEARSRVTHRRRMEAARKDQERIQREQAFKDAVFDALEKLGAVNPRLNLGDKIKRVDQLHGRHITWPCFTITYRGLFIRNDSSDHPGILWIADAEHFDRCAQFNTCSGAVEWLARIEKELVEPYLNADAMPVPADVDPGVLS